MKILITDASIFIDLLDCDACTPFFQLPYEIKTTYQGWRELEEEQQSVLHKWVKSKKLVMDYCGYLMNLLPTKH